MPACTACGTRVPTASLHAPGDDDGGLESCPNCAASWGAAEDTATTAAPGTSAAGNDHTTSKPAGRSRSRDESPNDEEPGLTVKTAGRSLEPPLGPSGVERSRTERSRSARQPDRSHPSRDRDRSPSVLSPVLDLFR